MHNSIPAALILTLLLSGCGDSRANPFNWFGSGEAPRTTVPIEETNPLIPESTGFFAASRAERERYKGVPIQAVTEVVLERIPGGLIIRADGLAQTQGVYNARLTPENDDHSPVDGVLTYRLEAQNDVTINTQGAPRTRAVTVAVQRTDQELAGAKTIRVEGVQNAIEVRRR